MYWFTHLRMKSIVAPCFKRSLIALVLLRLAFAPMGASGVKKKVTIIKRGKDIPDLPTIGRKPNQKERAVAAEFLLTDFRVIPESHQKRRAYNCTGHVLGKNEIVEYYIP